MVMKTIRLVIIGVLTTCILQVLQAQEVDPWLEDSYQTTEDLAKEDSIQKVLEQRLYQEQLKAQREWQEKEKRRRLIAKRRQKEYEIDAYNGQISEEDYEDYKDYERQDDAYTSRYSSRDRVEVYGPYSARIQRFNGNGDIIISNADELYINGRYYGNRASRYMSNIYVDTGWGVSSYYPWYSYSYYGYEPFFHNYYDPFYSSFYWDSYHHPFGHHYTSWHYPSHHYWHNDFYGHDYGYSGSYGHGYYDGYYYGQAHRAYNNHYYNNRYKNGARSSSAYRHSSAYGAYRNAQRAYTNQKNRRYRNPAYRGGGTRTENQRYRSSSNSSSQRTYPSSSRSYNRPSSSSQTYKPRTSSSSSSSTPRRYHTGKRPSR